MVTSDAQASDTHVIRLAKTLFLGSLIFLVLPIQAQSVLSPLSAGSSADVAPPSRVSQDIVTAAEVMKSLAQEEGGTIDYSNRIIEGDLDLFLLKGKDTNPTIIVKRPIRFSKTVFRGAIRTWDQTRELHEQPAVHFSGALNFIGARFEDHVSLDAAVFQEDSNFSNAHFHKLASFTDTNFMKDAGFRSVQFDERALFTRTAFHGDADFALAIFNWLAFFMEARFLAPGKAVTDTEQPKNPWANFLYSRFKGDTIFSNSVFEVNARFVGANFHGPTHFSEATFNDQVWFTGGSQFEDNVTFKGSRFLREGYVTETQLLKDGEEIQLDRPPVLFSGVIFSGDAIFAKAKFHQVSFAEVGTRSDIGRSTVFRRRVDFREAAFDTVDLRGVVFQSEADFSGADLGKKIDLTNVDDERASLRIELAQLLNTDERLKFEWRGAFADGQLNHSDKEVVVRSRRDFFNFLTSLERNFKQREQLSDANALVYLKEDLKRSERRGIPYVWNTLAVKGVYAYGVNVWHQVWVALVVIVGFAFVYARRNVLRRDPAKAKGAFLDVELPIDEWSGEEEGSQAEAAAPSFKSLPSENLLQRYLQGLKLSLGIFLKLKKPEGVYAMRRYVRYVAGIEWILGKLLWIVILVNLSNTWPLLHRLVTMLKG